MKIAVIGIGAVGGLIAARLARAGHEVSALARGATLASVREHGVRIDSTAGSFAATLPASDDAHALGPQDLVVIAVKAPALPAVAEAIAPLLGPATILLPAMNGVPWWFMPAATADEAPLESVDAGGRLLAMLPLERVLGCVVHLACSSPEPGRIVHSVGERLIVGEPKGGPSARCDAVCAVLASAGFQADPSDDVRSDVWFKLWGNMTMNPVSALTGATTATILDDPLLHAYVVRCMGEAAAIGARIGCPIAQSAEERMAITRQLGGFRTSMLQDVDAGRAIELDALVGAVHEIAGRVGVEVPGIAALLGLTRVMARERGLYPARR